MKCILVILILSLIFSCKKENEHSDTITPPPDTFDIVEGDIIWGGDSSAHIIIQPPFHNGYSNTFYLDTPYPGNNYYKILIFAESADTMITLAIQNPDLNKPGIYNFQDLDANHYVFETFQSGYWTGLPQEEAYYGISYSNPGRLTIDTISEYHISGSIDAYCPNQNIYRNISDTNVAHLLFHFSGALQKD